VFTFNGASSLFTNLTKESRPEGLGALIANPRTGNMLSSFVWADAGLFSAMKKIAVSDNMNFRCIIELFLLKWKLRIRNEECEIGNEKVRALCVFAI
jgi:hypothetical protein